MVDYVQGFTAKTSDPRMARLIPWSYRTPYLKVLLYHLHTKLFYRVLCQNSAGFSYVSSAKAFSCPIRLSCHRSDSDVQGTHSRTKSSKDVISSPLCQTIYDSSSYSQPAGSTEISRRLLTISLKRSGYTRSSAKAIGSDSLISRGVGWASRRKHSDGKPSSNSLELSPQIRFYAGSGPSLPENTTGLPNEGPEGQECAIRLPIKSSRWQTITRPGDTQEYGMLCTILALWLTGIR